MLDTTVCLDPTISAEPASGPTDAPFDGNTLQWSNSRWYNPTAQRWQNPDPSGLGPDANPYRYCENDPTNGTDPTGLATILPDRNGNPVQDSGGTINAVNGIYTGAGLGTPATSAKLVPTLPPFNGTTQGVLLFDEGGVANLSSGNKIPAISNYPLSGHVEGKAAYAIRQTGSSGGIVYHNNPNGTCGFCDLQTETILPEDSMLDAVPPKGAIAPDPTWVDIPSTYEGNSSMPKANRTPIAGENPVYSSTEVPIEASAKPGFLRANAGAIGTAVGISALNGIATAVIHLGQDVALKTVTDPKSDPAAALQDVQFLRDQFESSHSGQGYAVWHLVTGTVRKAQKEEADGRAWLDQAEAYWKGQQLQAATNTAAARQQQYLNGQPVDDTIMQDLHSSNSPGW